MECVYQTCQCVYLPGADECFSDEMCSENNAPIAYDLTVNPGPYCAGIPGAGIAIFEWFYYDLDGDRQAQFELQIDNNSDFSSPEVDRLVNTIFSGVLSVSSQEQIILTKAVSAVLYGDYINYGTGYYWRVKVADELGLYSDWIYYCGTISDPICGVHVPSSATAYEYEYSHPAPSPYITYSFSGETPQLDKDIFFSDSLSVCYTNDGGIIFPISCRALYSCIGSNCYIWNFDDGSPYDYTTGEVSHIYTVRNNYNPSLTVCDEIGCCSSVTDIPVGLFTKPSVPRWQEITPF